MKNQEINTGIVVDAHRFSLHDGPGIRTTIFLKGCPLSCKWCHNPEAVSYKPQLSFNSEKCTNCFECVTACPSGVHKIFDNKHVVSFEMCVLNQACVKACPNEALSIIGSTKSIGDIFKIVLSDKEFYSNSGGGITISGGEPMTQFEFTKSILILAKENSIHTCIETCGHAPTERYLEILDLVDLFLFDYKETDKSRHKDFTGVSNELILKNLSVIYDSGAKIILRCPLIPGVNDSEDHFAGIVELSRKFPNIEGIEIMSYHNIGIDKAEKIGMKGKYFVGETVLDIQKNEWIKKLNSYGCPAKLG
jgi:pyruvate formate lyase activating enzyme